MRAVRRLAPLVLIAAAGCGDDSFVGGALPAGAPVFRIAPGVATQLGPTGLPGYAISANLGGAYRLVWAGVGRRSRLVGSVWSPGRITAVFPGCSGVCPLEGDDRVSLPEAAPGGERVDFQADAGLNLEGFDFDVDTEPVYFDLRIDGLRLPGAVFFPAADNAGAISSPGLVPFALTTR